jgi:hypothetical protein
MVGALLAFASLGNERMNWGPGDGVELLDPSLNKASSCSAWRRAASALRQSVVSDRIGNSSEKRQARTGPEDYGKPAGRCGAAQPASHVVFSSLTVKFVWVRGWEGWPLCLNVTRRAR